MRIRYNTTDMKTEPFKIGMWVGVLLAFAGMVMFLLPRGYLFVRNLKGSSVSVSSPYPDEMSLRELLKTVKDPETDLSVVDMGLIRDIVVSNEGVVTVKMIFTTPECPYNWYLRRQIKDTLELVSSVSRVQVIIEKRVVWDPSLMTETGRAWLKRHRIP